MNPSHVRAEKNDAANSNVVVATPRHSPHRRPFVTSPVVHSALYGFYVSTRHTPRLRADVTP